MLYCTYETEDNNSKESANQSQTNYANQHYRESSVLTADSRRSYLRSST